MGQDLTHANIQLLYGAVLTNGKKCNLPITKEYILKESNNVFNGTGTLPGDGYHIKLKKDYKPVQHPPRSVSSNTKTSNKEELQWLCNEGIITPVWEHTEWTNTTLPLRKADGNLRLCLDRKDLNKSIERNQYYTRTIDAFSAEFHVSKYFTLLDTQSATGWFNKTKKAHCWQHSTQMVMATFWSDSSDVFQKRLDAVIKTVLGVTGIANDVSVR